MTAFSVYQTKRRTHINFGGTYYSTNNAWSDRNFEKVDPSALTIPTEWFNAPSCFTGSAATINEAYDLFIEHLKTEKEQRSQDRAVWEAKKQLKELELAEKAKALIANQPIPTTVENIRIIALYLNMSNWGSWNLPKFTINYTANQFDCDGVTATTITLEEPISDLEYGIKNATRFVVGAPVKHLRKYESLRGL